MAFFDFLRKKNISALSWAFLPGQIIIPDDKSITYIDNGYKSLPNVYSIISLITEKSSIVPFEVFKVKNRTKAAKYHAMMKNIGSTKDLAKAVRLKAEAMDKIENHEIDLLLSNPNKYQSAEDFNQNIDGYLLLTGNSYIWGISPGSGLNANKPKELHCLIAPTVTIETTKDPFNPVKAYRINYTTNAPIPPEEIGHLKLFNPLSSVPRPENLLYGLSPLMACRTLLGKYKNADIAQSSSFKNMGIAGVLTSDDGNISEAQARDLQDNFTNFHTGSTAANTIKVTSAKLRWFQLGLSPVDLKIIEGKEEILGEICNVYHVPIGMFTKVNSTENNMVESRKMFITDAVVPTVERRKALINRWLAPKFGDDILVEYDYTVFSEMNEDMEKLVKSADTMDWVTPNEKRGMTGYDQHPDPLMDKIYVKAGKVPLEDLSMEVPEVDETLLDA